MMVFAWHGGLQRAFRGIEMMLRGQVTHVGVPMHHRAREKHVKAFLAAGLGLIRTMEPPWNVGRDDSLMGNPTDLGRALIEWQGLDRPGRLFGAYEQNLMMPYSGIGWNMEHRALDYPVTEADGEWAREAGCDAGDLVAMRYTQFALLMRLYLLHAQQRNPAAIGIAYSGYPGLIYNRSMTLAEAYSVDWGLLVEPMEYRGHVLPPLTYAMPSTHMPVLPADAMAGIPTNLLVLHALGLPVYADDRERWRDYRTAIANRIAVARSRSGDGLGVMACSPLNGPWNRDEDRLMVMLAEELAKR